MDGYNLTFFCLALACMGISLWTDNGGMRRTVWTLLGCFAVGVVWRTVTVDSNWPWFFYAVTDAIAAWIIMRNPAGKWQGWIGLCFIIQMCVNIGYGGALLDQGYSYEAALLAWKINSLMGYIKLLLLGVWGGVSVVALRDIPARSLSPDTARTVSGGSSQ